MNEISRLNQLDVRNSFAKEIKSVQNLLKLMFGIEGVSRSTVYKSFKKVKNGRAVDHKPQSDQNRYKPLAKKNKIIKKISEVVTSFVKLARICNFRDKTPKKILDNV